MCRQGLHLGLHFLYSFAHITPLIMTRKNGLTPIFAVCPPHLFHITGGIIPVLERTNNQVNLVFTRLSGRVQLSPSIKSVRAVCFKGISCYYKGDSSIVICSFRCCQSLICCFEIEILVCAIFLSFYSFKLCDCFIKEIIGSICNLYSSFIPFYDNRFHNH